MVRPSQLGDLDVFMCKSKRRRRWSRIAWNGPRSEPLSCAVAREIGGLGEQQGREERHHATAALRCDDHWAGAAPRVSTSSELKRPAAAVPIGRGAVTALNYIIKSLSRQPRTIFRAGIGRELRWAFNVRGCETDINTRGRRRVTARRAKMIQLKVCMTSNRRRRPTLTRGNTDDA